MTSEIANSAKTITAAGSPGRLFALVLNPASGALAGGTPVSGRVRAAFARHGLRALEIPPEAGDRSARVALAGDSGAEALVVVGGDGTVSCAAQALAGTNVPLSRCS